MLKQLAENLWVVDQDLKLLGVNAGTRMSVIRDGKKDSKKNSGKILLISPVRISEDLGEDIGEEIKSELASLGEVTWVLAPNTYHHVYLNSCRRAYPTAKYFAPLSLVQKRQDFHFDGVVEVGSPCEIPFVEWELFASHRKFSEVLVYHAESRTLVVTDIVFNLHDAQGWWPRLMMRINGCHEKAGPSRLLKLFFKDREAVTRSIQWALGRDFQRIVLAHGQIIETNARAVLTSAYAGLI